MEERMPTEYVKPPLFRLSRYLLWVHSDLHPLFGGRREFTAEDTCYWVERYISEWQTIVSNPATADLPEADKDIRLRNLLTREYRSYGVQGEHRERPTQPEPLPAIEKKGIG
jgi:hypothetical protein